ncbi:MAG: Zn-ribbon domain-containing OB-fold protein [Deltaproteobacteria bacterium]|nr:Zn-ribbon domain-containing OB-fold protein [Deltaproteobacteria bacterium]
MGKTQVPAIEGWFTTEAQARLLGSRCKKCRSYFFPKEALFCRNPGCAGTEFEEVPLSRTGKVWSFTTNHYQPPAPYVSPDPFVPYTVAAVELAQEQMVVLGQVAAGVDPKSLRVGMNVELVLETLYQDDKAEYLVWKWKPVNG